MRGADGPGGPGNVLRRPMTMTGRVAATPLDGSVGIRDHKWLLQVHFCCRRIASMKLISDVSTSFPPDVGVVSPNPLRGHSVGTQTEQGR